MNGRVAKQVRRAALAPSVAELGGWLQRLAETPETVDDATRIDLLAAMERLKGGLCAAQAKITVNFKESQEAAPRALGEGAARTSVASQVGLARRESPNRAGRLVGLAVVLVHEMPRTMAALTTGDLSEWRATLLARETACLSREDRGQVDAMLADRATSMSDREVIAEAQRLAYQLDPHGFLDRAAQASKDRTVTLRPVPDVMSRLSALLPTVQGVAVYAALCREADRRKAAGDPCSRSQLLADILVERATGQTRADQTPIEVGLLMTAETLFGGAMTPAVIPGYGPIPAPLARDLLHQLSEHTTAWIRRLLTDPVTGRLTSYDPRRRLLSGTSRDAIIWRDQWCRTPWCGAPIRHIDHPIRTAEGGPTTEANSQGLCESCNYTKEALGWHAKPDPDGGAAVSVTLTTPTGHSYRSRPPPLPGTPGTEPRPAPPTVPFVTLRWSDILHPTDAA